jgi:signal peptide peptidase SppA
MKYLHIAERLFNRPLMIAEPKLNVILHLFGQRSGIDLVGLPNADLAAVSDRERQRAGYRVQDGTAIIGIYGPLLHRRMDMEFPSGGPMTYAEVQSAIDTALADDVVHSIVLDVDSPGGEVSGAFDLADHIYQARSQKPITAIANEGAYSAGYLLASSASRLVLPRTAGVGSVGVISTHADFSRAEDAAGITVTHIYAGERKADFSPHQPLSDDALAEQQAKVNDTYDLFVETVARNRGMKVQAVRDTQAGIYEGKKAVAMKLADEVAAADKAIASARTGTTSRKIAAPSAANAKEKKAMTLEELKENHPDLYAQVQAEARQGMIAQAEADTAKAEAASAERTRCIDLVGATLGEETGSKLQAVVDAGLDAEQVKKLGISVAPAEAAASTAQQQMLDAITAAAPKGVKAAGVQDDEHAKRKNVVDFMAKAGSVK